MPAPVLYVSKDQLDHQALDTTGSIGTIEITGITETTYTILASGTTNITKDQSGIYAITAVK